MEILHGTIRRWTRGFGFVNYYDAAGELERFFVHPKNVKPGVVFRLDFGVRIQFVAGEARHVGECRTALEIEPLMSEEIAEAGLEKLAGNERKEAGEVRQ